MFGGTPFYMVVPLKSDDNDSIEVIDGSSASESASHDIADNYSGINTEQSLPVFSTYKELLAKGNHSMSYISRIRIIATEIYKALNKISPKYLQDIIEKSICEYNLCASSLLDTAKM